MLHYILSIITVPQAQVSIWCIYFAADSYDKCVMCIEGIFRRKRGDLYNINVFSLQDQDPDVIVVGRFAAHLERPPLIAQDVLGNGECLFTSLASVYLRETYTEASPADVVVRDAAAGMRGVVAEEITKSFGCSGYI